MTMDSAHLSIVEYDCRQVGVWAVLKRGILEKELIQYGKEKVKEYLIFCKSPDEAIGSLSGGNIQKAVLARELSSAPLVIVANQPSRGVDVGATEFIRRRLIDMRDSGSGVLLVSSDLNEVLGLSDSLIVMFEGKVAAYIPNASELSEEELGSYMLGAKSKVKQRYRRHGMSEKELICLLM